jgi:alpha-N-arabinofuranosidase
VDGPSYKTKRFDKVPYIDASASLDGDNLVVNVVNRHQDRAIDVAIGLEDKSFAGPVTVSEVNGPDIKAQNDFGSSPVTAKSRPVEAHGNSLNISLAPHSYTQLKARLA